jgi:glycosyltransferase involved in cell wall biosynthesis
MQKNGSPESCRKIIFFFPYNPCPPRSGAQIRCLEILSGLLALKCEVIFLSSRNFLEKSWDTKSTEYLKEIGIKDISIYQRTFFDFIMSAVIRRMYLIIHRLPPVDSIKNTPFGMRVWFKKIQCQYNPDVIWMNYSYHDPLIDRKGQKNYTSVIDYHDLASLNQMMQIAVKKCFTGKPYKMTDRTVLREDFFNNNFFYTDKKELQVITSYDKIVAISQGEADLLQAFNRNASIIHIPVTCTPVNCNNSYDESAIFVTGPNAFNLQGFFYFTDRILPTLIQHCPGFNLWVAGACSDKVRPVGSVSLLGYVEDLEKYYCAARFAISPVLGGTGQQIKIIEAMAHGLPVVASAYSAKTSPIAHGVNGFIANDANEFAGYCIKLWQNTDLCREMGTAARKTIQDNFSEDLLMQKLSEVLS